MPYYHIVAAKGGQQLIHLASINHASNNFFCVLSSV